MGLPLLIAPPSSIYRVVDLLHRWTGGLVGMLLVLLAATGVVLTHKNLWVGLPHVHDPQVQDTEALVRATERMMAVPGARGVVFADEGFGLNRVGLGEEAALYANQAGEEVVRWSSKWERPEAWIFDLHHHLLAGDTGEIVAGIAGLCGLFFVLSGVFLWWRLRSGFELRLWPRRMTRPAILRHHRDLGVLVAPLLAVTLVTGATMIFQPVAGLVMGPGTSAEVARSFEPPPKSDARLAARPDWRRMLETARARYPDAEVRILSLPRDGMGYISLRLRQPREWLPNGRTTLWFEADTGRLAHVRDALRLPPRVQAYNAFYPIHAAKVGGLSYRLVVTVSGVALAALGGLAVWTFWFGKAARKPSLQPAE